MIDHVGFPASDYERAKAFYKSALAPLGYTLIMEVGGDVTASGHPAAGFGRNGKPDFWIGGEGKLEKPLHIAIVAEDRAAVDAFHRNAAIRPVISVGPAETRHRGTSIETPADQSSRLCCDHSTA